MVVQTMSTYLRSAVRRTVAMTVITLLVVGGTITSVGVVLFKALVGHWPVPDPFGVLYGLAMTAGALASYAVGGWMLKRKLRDAPGVLIRDTFTRINFRDVRNRIRVAIRRRSK